MLSVVNVSDSLQLEFIQLHLLFGNQPLTGRIQTVQPEKFGFRGAHAGMGG